MRKFVFVSISRYMLKEWCLLANKTGQQDGNADLETWSDIIFHPLACKGGDGSCVREVVDEVGEKIVDHELTCNLNEDL